MCVVSYVLYVLCVVCVWCVWCVCGVCVLCDVLCVVCCVCSRVHRLLADLACGLAALHLLHCRSAHFERGEYIPFRVLPAGEYMCDEDGLIFAMGPTALRVCCWCCCCWLVVFERCMNVSSVCLAFPCIVRAEARLCVRLLFVWFV